MTNKLKDKKDFANYILLNGVALMIIGGLLCFYTLTKYIIEPLLLCFVGLVFFIIGIKTR